ncbi:pre-mRNA-splicing factor CWC22 homolog [Gossypium hirsutum]|uniref:Pre-mRNA-splicing factor CWC22 homolog n=1 Tax=Gossypium hirsutum TaxID=3635 RepID=A0A1U8KBY6_GOSHI|nr:pre-mRNA-splicing factor CWC22 homolog [Gossypium hirsutum]
MMKETQDKSSDEYQRLTWDALRKSIKGLVNKMASPSFTDVFAALVTVVNTKFPEVGDLLLRKIVLQLKRAYKRNDKHQLLAAVKFIAHLVNQQVAHEIIALELLTVLLEYPTDDSVEVAVGFVTECGSLLQDLSPKCLHVSVGCCLQGYPVVCPELDLVEEDDQLTHEISLQDEIDPEITLGSSDEEEDEEEDECDEEDKEQMKIKDETETNLVNLRRTIYLTIMSSVDFKEAGHRLLKIKLDPGQESGENIPSVLWSSGVTVLHDQQNALPWHVLAYIRLTEEDTTSSSQIFIKILFQELSEHLGIQNLREYLKNMPRLNMQQQKPASESESSDESGSLSSSASKSANSESDSSSSDEHEKRRKKRRRR